MFKPQHAIFDMIGLEQEDASEYLGSGEILSGARFGKFNRHLAKCMDNSTDKRCYSEFSTKKLLWCCKEHRIDGALSCAFCLCSEYHSNLILNEINKENERTNRPRKTNTEQCLI